MGPGPLDLAGALESTDLGAIVLGTITEGCIGETVAAIEAAEALAHCEDEAARPTLERIARDETRHAQLAWQFVAWALEVGPATLREKARAAFADAIQVEPARGAPGAQSRTAHVALRSRAAAVSGCARTSPAACVLGRRHCFEVRDGHASPAGTMTPFTRWAAPSLPLGARWTRGVPPVGDPAEGGRAGRRWGPPLGEAEGAEMARGV